MKNRRIEPCFDPRIIVGKKYLQKVDLMRRLIVIIGLSVIMNLWQAEVFAKEEGNLYNSKLVVARVYAGDSLILSNGDRVSLIGVLAPSALPLMFYGVEALMFAEKEILGKEVRIEYDGEKYDDIERIRVYLFRASDNICLNKIMVNEGYAFAGKMEHKYLKEFQRLEDEARKNKRGMWGWLGKPPPPVSYIRNEKVGELQKVNIGHEIFGQYGSSGKDITLGRQAVPIVKKKEETVTQMQYFANQVVKAQNDFRNLDKLEASAKGGNRDALRELERLYKTATSFSGPYPSTIAEIYAGYGDYAEAIRYQRKAVLRRPIQWINEDILKFLEYQDNYRHQGGIDTDLLQKTIAVNEKELDRIELLEKIGEKVTRQDDFIAATRSMPAPQRVFLIEKGDYFYQHLEFDKAEKLYELALAQAKTWTRDDEEEFTKINDWYLYDVLKNLYILRGKYRKAADCVVWFKTNAQSEKDAEKWAELYKKLIELADNKIDPRLVHIERDISGKQEIQIVRQK